MAGISYMKQLFIKLAWTLRYVTFAPARLRLIGLYLSIVLSDPVIKALQRLGLKRPLLPSSNTEKPGVSIIIPERGNRLLLEKCLDSVYTAARKTREPVEVIVVVNGSERINYRQAACRFKAVRWAFYNQPMGFSSAVGKGLRMASFDWVYLLNNDMIMEPDALENVLQWRSPRVFAVASQIFFIDPEKRREETGWTDMSVDSSGVTIFDVPPEDDKTVRGTLYAGGGASLFNRRILQRIMSRSDPYFPFYWEDVEWGIRAWTHGYEVLFCPTSVCRHHHRATVRKFYRETEINRVFQRNSLLFEIRHRLEKTDARQTIRRIIAQGEKTQREMGHPLTCINVFMARIQSATAPISRSCLKFIHRKFYYIPHRKQLPAPTILIITPYAVIPPSHGGAVRITSLIRRLSSRCNVTLLSDEENLYRCQDISEFNGLCAVHLIGDRPEAHFDPEDRIQRIFNHCHDLLIKEMDRLCRVLRPDIAQIEFIELAGLPKIRGTKTARILVLHDVLVSEARNDPEDLFELSLMRQFDRVVTCCSEDAALITDVNPQIVPNGADLPQPAPALSRGKHTILFMGPFRYHPNLIGIRIFLETVYPKLLSSIPNLNIVILGGTGSRRLSKKWNCFDQKGIQIIDKPVAPRPFLEECAVTINPIYGMRGSSLKLIESIFSARVCVSTKDGARGFTNSGFSSLITVERIEQFHRPLEKLLLDEKYRLCLETPCMAKLTPFTWKQSANRLSDLYQCLIQLKS